MRGGQAGLGQSEEGAPVREVGWRVEWAGVGGSRPLSAEVARARDLGNLVFLVVQGQRLRVGTALYRTPVPLRI